MPFYYFLPSLGDPFWGENNRTSHYESQTTVAWAGLIHFSPSKLWPPSQMKWGRKCFLAHVWIWQNEQLEPIHAYNWCSPAVTDSMVRLSGAIRGIECSQRSVKMPLDLISCCEIGVCILEVSRSRQNSRKQVILHIHVCVVYYEGIPKTVKWQLSVFTDSIRFFYFSNPCSHHQSTVDRNRKENLIPF